MRIDARAERELSPAARTPGDDHTLEACAELATFVVLSAKFGERISDTDGDQAMVALVRQIGRASLDDDIGTQLCERGRHFVLVAAQAVLDDRQSRLGEEREALRLVNEAARWWELDALGRRG